MDSICPGGTAVVLDVRPGRARSGLRIPPMRVDCYDGQMAAFRVNWAAAA